MIYLEVDRKTTSTTRYRSFQIFCLFFVNIQCHNIGKLFQYTFHKFPLKLIGRVFSPTIKEEKKQLQAGFLSGPLLNGTEVIMENSVLLVGTTQVSQSQLITFNLSGKK